jgi:hypothetical protein
MTKPAVAWFEVPGKDGRRLVGARLASPYARDNPIRLEEGNAGAALFDFGP